MLPTKVDGFESIELNTSFYNSIVFPTIEEAEAFLAKAFDKMSTPFIGDLIIIPVYSKSDILVLKVADVFSIYPGPRKRSVGANSAEEFRDKILLKWLGDAIIAGKKLIVNLDGTSGFAVSFLAEAFGTLCNYGYSFDDLERSLDIVSNEMPEYASKAWGFILDSFRIV